MGANAQTTVPTFTASQVLTAAQMNDSARTGVPVFATTITRDAAFGGIDEKTLAEGQMCYIEAAPKRLQVYNGTAWIDFDAEWQAYTPTFTGLTLGNGTLIARYVRIGKTISGYISVGLGSTSSVTARIIATLPAQIKTNSTQITNGILEDASPANSYFSLPLIIASDIYLDVMLASSTYVQFQVASSTVPFTWANGDSFKISFTYEAN